MVALLMSLLILLPVVARAEPVTDDSALKAASSRTAPLTISEVLARIELTHPLLQAAGAERAKARAKILKALAAWEPTFKNVTRTQRFQTWNLTTSPTIFDTHNGDLLTPS